MDGTEGALRLTGDKPTVKLAGGPIAGNQSWIIHVGSDGPGNLEFFKQGASPTSWENVMTLSPSGNVGIGTAIGQLHLEGGGVAVFGHSSTNTGVFGSSDQFRGVEGHGVDSGVFGLSDSRGVHRVIRRS